MGALLSPRSSRPAVEEGPAALWKMALLVAVVVEDEKLDSRCCLESCRAMPFLSLLSDGEAVSGNLKMLPVLLVMLFVVAITVGRTIWPSHVSMF